MAIRVGKTVRVVGLVQGVWFRAWIKEQADALGVGGWVRNWPDGSVEALLVGEEAAVAQLVERLHGGPPAARVERVEVDEVAVDECEGFEVRR